MSVTRVLCYAWALPNTGIGLLLACTSAATGGTIRIVDGVLEVHGGFAAWYLRRVVAVVLPGGASAITFGHVVLARDREALEWSRAHERIHVRQYEHWGPLFIPAYLFTSFLALLRGRNPYLDNPFEREAYRSGDPRA